MIVNAPNTLSVNGTLNFVAGKRLEVKPGARLIVSNTGKLTSACPTLWNGVWAVKTSATLPHTEIENYGIIENAVRGIYASGRVRLQSINATYINNKQDVYINNTPTTFSWFHSISGNNFTTNTATMAVPTEHVTLNKAGVISIVGNSFSNSNPLLAIGTPVGRGTGIYIAGTNSFNYDIGLCAFSGLQYGIKTGFNTDIHDCNFLNNNRGILLENQNSTGSKIIGNLFDSNKWFFDNTNFTTQLYTYPCGILLQNCPNYIVEGNTLLSGTIGIGLINNTATGNVIYRNDIYGNSVGLAAYLNNNAKLTCNDFVNPSNLSSTNIADYNVKDVLIYKGTLFGTQDHAYHLIDYGPPSINSHNRYTASKDNDPTPNYAHKFKVKSPLPPYQYYNYYFGAYDPPNNINDLTRIEPLPNVSGPYVTTYGNLSQFWDGGTYCNPVNLTLKSVHASLAQVDSLKALEDNMVNYLNAVVDNGNTDYLLTLIQNLQPNNFTQAYNQLLSSSPYLSDTVLIPFMLHTINKPAHKTNLVIANSPLPNNVRLYINEMNVNQHFKLIMWAAQNGSNPRENLENEIANINFGSGNKFEMLLTTVLTDTNDLRLDSVLTYVFQKGTLSERLVTNPVFIGKEKYADAQSNLNSISSLNNTVDFQVDDFIHLQELQIQFNQADDSLQKSLLRQSELWLNEIAVNSVHSYQSSALSFLEQLYDTTYGRAIDIGDDNTERLIQIKQNGTIMKETGCIFYVQPNPASTSVNIIFSSEEIFGNENLVIYNSDGKRVKLTNTVEDKRLYIIDVNNLNKGNYFVALEYNNRILGAQKLIIE